MSHRGAVWSAALGVAGIVATLAAVATFGSSCAADSEAHAERHMKGDVEREGLRGDVTEIKESVYRVEGLLLEMRAQP